MKMKTLSFLILALSVCFITAEIEQDQFSNEVITSDHDAMIKSSDGISSVQKELTKKTNEPAAKQKFDSYGNPIVNETPALPDWAEQDVSALKEEIQKTLEQRDNFQKNKRDVNVIREIEYNLGNFIGQALIREIDISTIIDLHDRKTINKTVSQSVFDFLHYYENEKYALAEMMKKEYEQTNYNSQILDFISFYQGNENELLKIESTRATPSGEYTHYYGTVGMTNLTGATTIWDGSAGTYIDVSEDVPIGFNFYFYQGDDPDVNTEVRVSTHGYSTMYQQGGGALDGTDWSNDAITSPTDPDGYIATWWDDIIVTDQGSTDKVSYKVEGSVGSRIFTVEYFSVTRNGGDTDDFHYFQTVFYEYFNRIWIKYGNWDADASDNATCGIEDYSGLDGDGGPNTLNSNDVRPTYNYAFYPGIQGLWTGNISTDWDDADNWDDGFVPNQYDDVVIPAGCPNYPELTGQLGIDTADHDYDCNSLTIDSGASLLVTGHSVNSYGELTVAGTLDIGDDLYLYSGSTVDLSGTIQIGTTAGWYGQALHYSGSTFNQTAGHYYVESIYLQNGSQFNGTGGRTHIYVDDFSGDNSVEIDDPDSYFYSFQVDIGASALLFSCDYDLEVTYDTDLNGPLDINSFTMNSQYFDVFNEGELIIDSGGTVNVTGNGPYFHDGGSLTMNSGSELNSELHILFQTGSIENVSGGDIFLGSSFSDADDIFSPTGGSVTFDGSSTSYIYGTTAFYDLNIDKTGANTVFLNSDCVVTNDLTITEGELTLNGYELTVDDNCSVYGTLNMTNAADVLNAGSTSYDQFYFYDGSTGNISAGNIYLAWGMVVYSGSSFTATTSNTIHYNSATFRSGISNGDPNTVFGNIEVDKSSGYFQIWADGIEPIVVDGDFTLAADNEMETLDLSMVVNGTFSETSSSAIYLYNYPFRASGDSDNGSNSTENAEGNYREGSRDRGGYLEIDTDFTLNGLMDVGDGDALI
ncbi:MAG TPA: hypothetical protein ENL20_01290, partial [Candidatus Cloacimonetes bacterium]|nr:hypothetical protein [Candidatus Cloacimonadota bacterium]